MLQRVLAQELFQMLQGPRMKKHLALNTHQGSLVDEQLENLPAMRALRGRESACFEHSLKRRRFESGFLIALAILSRNWVSAGDNSTPCSLARTTSFSVTSVPSFSRWAIT